MGRIPANIQPARNRSAILLTMKTGWVGDVLETNPGQVTKDGGRSVGRQVGIREPSQVNTPTPFSCGQLLDLVRRRRSLHKIRQPTRLSKTAQGLDVVSGELDSA